MRALAAAVRDPIVGFPKRLPTEDPSSKRWREKDEASAHDDHRFVGRRAPARNRTCGRWKWCRWRYRSGFLCEREHLLTVGTPTDLSSTGTPTDSFDIIYDFGGAQLNVAEAAPGDTDYNGGRWRVQLLSFSTNYTTTMAAHDLDGSGVIDSDAEVLSALGDAGPAGATIAGSGPSSVCPVILIP
jgi:hypothetical protein